jgi:hypothetical protein
LNIRKRICQLRLIYPALASPMFKTSIGSFYIKIQILLWFILRTLVILETTSLF